MADDKTLDLLLRKARTHGDFSDKPVSDEVLRAAHRLSHCSAASSRAPVKMTRLAVAGPALRARSCVPPPAEVGSLPARAQAAVPDLLGAFGAAYPRPTEVLRELIASQDAEAVIPCNPTRKRLIPYSFELYKLRNRIERCFNKLKQFRRIATRYDKTARNYLAMVTVAATVLWLR